MKIIENETKVSSLEPQRIVEGASSGVPSSVPPPPIARPEPIYLKESPAEPPNYIPPKSLIEGALSSVTELRSDMTAGFAATEAITDDLQEQIDTLPLSTMFNVKDYGAVGDGNSFMTDDESGGGHNALLQASYGGTDDTAAILAAIAALNANGGGVLFFPKGIYCISSTLTISSNTIIRGEGRYNTGIKALTYHMNIGTMIRGYDVQNVTIENFRISGCGMNGNSSVGIFFSRIDNDNTPHIIMRNVLVENHAGSGIIINRPILCTFENVKVVFFIGNGFSMTSTSGDGGTSCTFNNCYAITGTECGFLLDTVVYATFISCAAESCGIGYNLVSCSAIALIGCGSEANIYRSAGYPGIGYKTSDSRNLLMSCYDRSSDGGAKSGPWQIYNFRDQADGGQVMTVTSLVKNDVGLGNVDNTSDANKPISTAAQTAIDEKAPDNDRFYLFEDFLQLTTNTVLTSENIQPSGLKFVRMNTNGGGITFIDHVTTGWVGNNVNPIGIFSVTTYSSSVSYFRLPGSSNLHNLIKGWNGIDFTIMHAANMVDIDDNVTYGSNLWFGLNNVASGTNEGGDTVNAIMFRRTYGANWFAVTRAAGVETATDLGIKASYKKFLKLRFIVAADNSNVKFYIDDVLLATHTTYIPSTSVTGTVVLRGYGQSAASGGSIGYFDYLRVTKER